MGIVLVRVAVFLTVEIKSLLIGESADPHIAAIVDRAAHDDPLVEAVRELITVQQGPGELLVALKLRCAPNLEASAVSAMTNRFEARVRDACPQARWIFVEPDLEGALSVRYEPEDG